MSNKKKEPSGCGCANIPISVIIILVGAGYGLFTQRDKINIYQIFPQLPKIASTNINSAPITSPVTSPLSTQAEITPVNKPVPIQPQIPASIKEIPSPNTTPNNIKSLTSVVQKPLPTAWQKKVIKGIYLSRYQVTNNADEKTIRDRVIYYKSQGFNTIIHGVWGNGCSMYHSKVMQKTLGYKSCPNEFQDKWLDWLIDEAHKQGMEVHAYFERGIKIDKNSPIYNLAVTQKWLVPGVDKTYAGLDQYVLDVENTNVANYLTDTLVEFVKRYPQIDAVQWDDYLAYHAELPGKINRTDKLTAFMQRMIKEMKIANSHVSFDICHHNPYWAKQYFAADWLKWGVDNVFIQAYNDKNFQDELNYVKDYQGVAISESQSHRLQQLVNNPDIKSILIFPLNGNPEITAANINKLLQNVK
ncbi:MAG: glycoside hydrolase family 10 protein [Nostocales cyanobacterium]|nr:MAG: glycoside hydrolase family 10 protein [Nostocales cyanobacterium]TAF18730.1 MAG: glycoside hydrolase family 10 protein [Nostocales cyanobacterium]